MNRPFRFFSALIGVACIGACAVPSARVKTSSAEVSTTTTPAAQNSALEEPSVLQSDSPESEQEKIQHHKIVRVLLAENQPEAFIKHSNRVNIFTQDETKKYKISQAGTIAVKGLANGQIQVGTLKSTQPVWIEPADATLEWKSNSYTGKFLILPGTGSTFSIVEYVKLEDYLYGVLPYEMSPSWPVEALKAQAVAARTYTLKSLENVKNKNFDLYSDVRSQMYRGNGKRYDNVTRAIDETKGEILTYQDNLFFTYYHANCGGATDDVSSWHFSTKSIKPLSGASCNFDSHSKSYSWSMTIPTSKVEKYAQSVGLKGTLKSIRIVRKTGTGRATNLTLSTTKGSKTVPCGAFRLATGIRSCKITRVATTTKGVQFAGRGYGHGIGMCQDGAYGMAKRNHSYKEILKHYYPGASLEQLK